MPNGQIGRSENEAENVPSTELALRETSAQLPSAADADKIMVVLVRAGVGTKKYMVPPGSTVADLLEAADATSEGQDAMIGPDKVEQDHVFAPNSILFMVPRPKNA